MLSPEGQRIRLWLLQKVKNAHPPSSIQEARVGVEAFAARASLPPGIRIEPVAAGSVPAEWVGTSDSINDKVILHLHGGGYTMGSCTTARGLASLLSVSSGMRVLSVGYRLAPEYPFPAAIEDATAAYRWLLSRGIPPRQIIMTGESSGGGLVLAAQVALRDDNVVLPAGAVLFSPWTDLACTGGSMITRAEADPWLTADWTRSNAALYAGGEDLCHPLISPLYADLRSLPPLLIHVGSDEILLDDSTRVAERAKAVGIDVTLNVWNDMWHVWHCFALRLPEGQRAMEQIARFIQQRLG